MNKRFVSLSHYGTGWSSQRRSLLIAAVLVTLLAAAAGTAYLTTRTAQHVASSRPAPSASSPLPRAPATRGAAGDDGSVSQPPRLSEPVAFAKAAAKMLWSYDTRTTSHEQQLDGMKAWMTTESEYGDWTSIAAQMPSPILWSRMADQEQHASAEIAEAHYPAAFQQALAQDPAAITKAYIYAVTVTGKQTITWSKGGGGAEDRAITLAVQCRPSANCSLVAIAPRVAP